MEELTITDAQVNEQLSMILGHAPPFCSREIEQAKAITISYAAELDWLAFARDVRVLTVAGCEFSCSNWLPPPGQAARLSEVTFRYSSLSELAFISGYSALARVDVTDTLVQDISALFSLPKLRSVTLRGCPLNDESFRDLLPRLRDHVPPKREQPVHVGDYPMADWNTTRLIQSRGIRAVYSQGKALAPGLAYSDMPDLHSYAISHDEVKRVLDQVDDGDLKGFMDRCKQIAFSK